MFAGFGGALKGLLALGVTFAIMAVLPTVVASVANRGTLDISSFLPCTPTPSSQSAAVDVEGSREECAEIRKALGNLALSVRSSTLKIIVTAPQDLPPDAGGTYTFPDNVIHISRDVVLDPVHQGLSHVLAHEMGHMFDSLYLDVSSRSEFMVARGHDPNLDWTGDDLAWEQRPQEDFAEVFAAIAAPASRVMIQTDGGRIDDPERMSALLGRFERVTKSPAASPRLSALPDILDTLFEEVATEPGAFPVVFGLAVVCSTIGAIGSMQRVCFRPARARKRRRRNEVGAPTALGN